MEGAWEWSASIFPIFPCMVGWTPQCIRSLEGGTCFDAVIRKQRGQAQSAHFCRRKNTCSTSLAKMILDHQMSVSTFSRICQEIATLGHKHGSFVKRRPCKRQSFGWTKTHHLRHSVYGDTGAGVFFRTLQEHWEEDLAGKKETCFKVCQTSSSCLVCCMLVLLKNL